MEAMLPESEGSLDILYVARDVRKSSERLFESNTTYCTILAATSERATEIVMNHTINDVLFCALCFVL